MQITNIAMSKILFDEDFNCRGKITPMDVVDLAKSIREEGLIQAVSVCPLVGPRAKANPGKEYLLIAGYRRFTAFKINEQDHIPAVIRQDITREEDACFFNLAENLQRTELNILQEARALKKLEELGISEEDAALRLKMSRGWVQVRYMVLRLPRVVQEEIAAGWMTQKQIRDSYSHYKDSGELACFAAVRQFKDDKIKGRKGTRKKVKKSKAKDLETKARRDIPEIHELQDHIYQEFGGNNIATRLLAWCAGTITSGDVHLGLQEWAKTQERTYRMP